MINYLLPPIGGAQTDAAGIDMMVFRRRIRFAVGLLPLLAASETSADDALQGKELHDLLFGNTLVGRHERADAEWSAYVDPYGRIHIKGVRPEGPYEFFGQVTIEGDRWCEQWQIKGHGDKTCRQIARTGDRFDVMHDDGHVISSFTVRPGDPNGLGGDSLAAIPMPTAPPVTADGSTGSEPVASETAPPNPPAAAATATDVAATPPPAPVEPAPVGTEPISLDLPQHSSAIALTNDSVIGWHRQGLDDAAIVALIKRSATAFDLSPKALETLDKAGISKTIIGAMLAADLAR
jgi:hypothetical protein